MKTFEMTVVKLAAILLIIFLLAILGIVVIANWAPYIGLPAESSKISVEAAKSLFQLIVVVLIGGVVTASFKALETSKKQASFKSQVRKDFLKRVGNSYRSAKSSRRSLRVAGLTDRFNNPPSTLNAGHVNSYQEQMKILNNAQLEIEAMKIESSSIASLVGLEELPGLLRSMEKYLGKLVKEYEEYSPLLLGSPNSVQFGAMGKLKEFTGKADRNISGGFEKCLATPHDRVIELLADRS